MAGCGGKKKYEEGGEVDKSKGVKGRTSRKAKKDQFNFQRGYAKGLSTAQRQFNIKGEVDTTKDKADKDNKFSEGAVKGRSDMKEALKGQGAYKKGGKVKKMQDGGMTAAAAGSMPTKEELAALLAEQRAAAMAAKARGGFSSRGLRGLGGVPGDMPALAPQRGGGGALGGMKKGGKVKNKMAKGGSVKKGCDGVATKGKTKGRMV